MRICITNDDGIHAEGLRVLASWAKKLGEVTIVAPLTQQSGKAHSIEFHHPYHVRKVEYAMGLKAFSVDSTPADCVRVALMAMNEPFDLVLSGVNCGYNLGREIIYSGTVGAALEAGLQGVKSVALSTGFDTFAGAEKHLDTAWDYVQRHRLLEKADVWNINIPEDPTGEVRLTHQGERYFSDEFSWQGDLLCADGKCVWKPSEDESMDTNAVLLHRCISVTPLTNDKTDWHTLEDLRKTGL